MSLRNALLTQFLRWWVKPRSLGEPSVEKAREFADRMWFASKPPSGWRVRMATLGGLDGEWVEPDADAGVTPRRSILYLHGGGYVAMSARNYRALTFRLAAASEARLFALNYRLAPEHPFPAALDDAVVAYRALVAEGTTAARIVVAGDSAGGGLALALLLRLRDAGDPLPAAGVLFSPWTDLAATGKSLADNDGSDALFHGASIAPMARYYLAGTAATNPLASPVYAELSGLPPLLIQVSGSEVLLDDSRRVAENALRGGIAARMRIWPDLPHVWQLFAPFLPEARAALREAGRFVREQSP